MNKRVFPYKKGKIYKAHQEGETFLIKVLNFNYPSLRRGIRDYLQMCVERLDTHYIFDVNRQGYQTLNKYGNYVPDLKEKIIIDLEPLDDLN